MAKQKPNRAKAQPCNGKAPASVFAIPTPTPEFHPPEHALPIWLDERGRVRLGFRQAGGKAGHSVSLGDGTNAELLGKMLLRLLSDRARAPGAKIGQPGLPVQAMIDALASASVKVTHVQMSAEHSDTLEDIVDWTPPRG